MQRLPESVPEDQVSFGIPTQLSNCPDTVWAISDSQAVCPILCNYSLAPFYVPASTLRRSSELL
jgi:hypothetical protein